MNYAEALERIINDGIAAAKADYTKTSQEDHLAGSIAGFESCRDKSPAELWHTLDSAKKRSHCAMMEQAENYWWIRCFELEVEWVCNCVSAILRNQGLPEIICPTARGTMKAAEIIGISK